MLARTRDHLAGVIRNNATGGEEKPRLYRGCFNMRFPSCCA